jgi:hypothetical protein
MKLKYLLVLGLVALIQLPTFAQKKKKVSPKHVNYFKDASADTKDVKVEIQDAVAMMEFAKFKLRLTNNTNDYILYKPQESLFKLETGDFVPQDKKTIVLQPLDKESKVLDIKAPKKDAHVDAFKFKLDGLYKVATNVSPTEAPNFLIPASNNDFIAGNFKVEMLALDKSTGKAAVKFKVTYTGEGMGLVEPTKVGMKIPTNQKYSNAGNTGQIFANEKKEKGILLAKGESENFTVFFSIEGKIADMQFANAELLWRDTFKDCKMTKIEGTTIDVTLDAGLTEGKN